MQHVLYILMSLAFVAATAASQDTDPAEDLLTINESVTTEMQAVLDSIGEIKADADAAVDLYSRRGDARMFLGQFADAVADYQAMVKLKPELDASQWRLGIALYYADKPEGAAAQFDRYHSFDKVDRENGIWRYLSHHKAFGRDKAREQLLKYDKDDRPPFKEVYQLFDGRLSSDDVLKSITSDLPETARNTRLFYSHLYIGLLDAVEDRPESAQRSLTTATLNPWPRKSGFGPNWMWHVGRLELKRLQEVKAEERTACSVDCTSRAASVSDRSAIWFLPQQ